MRLSDERGFTMITVMLALFTISLLSVAAIAAANGDINLSRGDQNDKRAYAAAEAGVNDYLAHLDQDSNYWTKCLGPSDRLYDGVNQQFTGAPPAGRKWKDVNTNTASAAGTTNPEYSIELIPKTGETACNPSDPIASMIDGGNLTIRSTGRVGGVNGKKRSIVATFRRTGFLDFIYFTDLENQDPTYLDIGPYGQIPTRSGTAPAYSGQTYRQWAADVCDRYRWGPNGRDTNPQWSGQVYYNNSWNNITLGYQPACGEITFGTDDAVKGPFHSNDDIQVCGSPEFGRTTNNDKVEISGDEFHPQCGGSSPLFRPSLTTNAPSLELPPTNGSIQQAADANFEFSGATTLRMSGTNVTVTNAQKNGGQPYTTAMPANGVIYVKNISCGFGYDPLNSTNIDPDCGVATISGNYNQDLTIATEDDVIVDGNVTRTSDATSFVLGLVAKNFVRVWHPVTGAGTGSCANRSDTPKNIRIDAAILSLAHSFTVDNYNCGASLGTLTVNGVIAQKHRGIVATGSGDTGYLKNYNYDDKLKYRAPPYFLDPVQSSWRILRQTEQSPAR